MIALIFAAALATSEVTKAMFTIVKGETFMEPKKNAALQAILAQHPKLDVYETAALGTSEQLEAMLRDDPDAVNRPNSHGWTALHMAAFGGNLANAELLVHKGAGVNVRAKTKFLNTPLQAALLTLQYDVAKFLIENGADVLVRQAHGFTPMHEAAERGRADLIDLLLAHGAEINSMADDGSTPLAEAIRAHHDEIAALLKSKGGKTGPTPDEEVQPKKKP